MADADAITEAVARALFDDGNILGEETWESITEDDRESYRRPIRPVLTAQYAQLVALADAARAVVANWATRDDETIPNDEWLRTNAEAWDALTAAVDALDAPEATDGG